MPLSQDPLQLSRRSLQAALRCPRSLPFPRLNSPSSPSLSSQQRGSSPQIIAGASSGPAPPAPGLSCAEGSRAGCRAPTESQSGGGWKGPLWVIWSNPAPPAAEAGSEAIHDSMPVMRAVPPHFCDDDLAVLLYNGFQLLLFIAHATCISVDALELGCRSPPDPAMTHLGSSLAM